MLTRRSFVIGAALGAAGVAIKGKGYLLEGSLYPIAEVPEKPASVVIEGSGSGGGYLIGGQGFEPPGLPSIRAYHDFDSMRLDEKVDWVLERCEDWGIEPGTESWIEFCKDWELPQRRKKWSASVKADFIEAGLDEIHLDLDEEMEPDFMNPYKLMMCGFYGAGMTVFDALGSEKADELGLSVVEGDAPGRDFMGVYFEGSLDHLNRALRNTGLAIEVSDPYGAFRG